VFDAIYNYVVAHPRGLRRLEVAPMPRRFAQAMAGAVALAIGAGLLAGAAIAAWLLEAILVVAVLRVVFGDYCLGAHVYYVLRRFRTGQSLPTPCGSR
jgi:hypothetical protein